MSDIIVWVDKINNRMQFAGWRYSDEDIHVDHDKGINTSIGTRRFRRLRQYSYISTDGVSTISIVDKATGKTLDIVHMRGKDYFKLNNSICVDCVFNRNNKYKPKGLSLVYRQICIQCLGCASNGGFRSINEVLENL